MAKLAAKMHRRMSEIAAKARSRESSSDGPDFRIRPTKQHFWRIEVVSDAARDFVIEHLACTDARLGAQGLFADDRIASDLVSEFQKRGYVMEFEGPDGPVQI